MNRERQTKTAEIKNCGETVKSAEYVRSRMQKTLIRVGILFALFCYLVVILVVLSLLIVMMMMAII